MRRMVDWSEDMAYHKRIVESAKILGWISDAAGHCVYLSPRWHEFTGSSKDEGLDYDWLTYIHPDDQVRVRREFFNANDNQLEYSISYRLLAADGTHSLVWGHGVPRHDGGDTFLGYLGTTTPMSFYQGKWDALAAAGAPVGLKKSLTERERQVVRLMANGLSNEGIALELGIAVRTVEGHVTNLLEKLEASNRVHAVVKAMRLNVF